VGVFFGTAGIRGPVNSKITDEFALTLGLAVATIAEDQPVVVGSDYRLSSPALKRALSAGLMLAGANVFDLGYAPTPVIAFAGRNLKARFSISVTASHNPPGDNGFKVFSGEGYESTLELEAKIEEVILQRKFRLSDWKSAGSESSAPEQPEAYKKQLLASIKPFSRGLRIVVDCANGTASQYTPVLLSELGCKVVSMNATPDGRFPGRLPEPTPENLAATMRRVVEEKADFGIAHDGDGDRIAIIDERGNYVTSDSLLALFAREALVKHGPGRIITSVDTSFRIDEVGAKHGGAVERTRLGKTHSELVGPERGSVRLCCEPWKIIAPEWGYWGDAMYAALVFAAQVAWRSRPVSELFAEIPDYPQLRFAIDCPLEIRSKVMTGVEQYLRGSRNLQDVWNFDGIRGNYKDGSWVLVRPSGTEPKIRIYCEAHDQSRLQEIRSNIVQIVQRAVKE
jgi:phosphoglucosamine mutase